jgi:hypothetical protein
MSRLLGADEVLAIGCEMFEVLLTPFGVKPGIVEAVVVYRQHVAHETSAPA